jgi:hypothetical protein
MANTHFSGPVLYSGKGADKGAFTDLPIGVNLGVVTLFDDFTGVALDGTNDWTVVKDSGASAAIGADIESGVLLLTSAATTDNDGASVQGNEIFAVAAGRNIWFQTKCKVSDADDIDFSVGFTVNFATNPEAMLTAADRIVFESDDGTAVLQCITEKNGTETATALGSDFNLADDTYVTLGILVVGTSRVEFYVNNVLAATHTTNIPDDENLTVGAMELSGSNSGTKSATIDYIFAAQTR